MCIRDRNKRVKILASQKRIIYQPTNSFYQVLSAEAYSKHGFNIHGVVFDELHTQPNRKLFDVMTKGSGDARMQPLYFLITTAGTDTNKMCIRDRSRTVNQRQSESIRVNPGTINHFSEELYMKNHLNPYDCLLYTSSPYLAVPGSVRIL